MKYKVEITETLQKVVEVEAENKEEAIDKVTDMYNNEKVVLNWENCIDTDIDIFLN